MLLRARRASAAAAMLDFQLFSLPLCLQLMLMLVVACHAAFADVAALPADVSFATDAAASFAAA